MNKIFGADDIEKPISTNSETISPNNKPVSSDTRETSNVIKNKFDDTMENPRNHKLKEKIKIIENEILKLIELNKSSNKTEENNIRGKLISMKKLQIEKIKQKLK